MATAFGMRRTPYSYTALGLVLAMVLGFLTAEYAVVSAALQTRGSALRELEATAQLTTDAKAKELTQLLNDLYVTTRTVTLLPAVRSAPQVNRDSDAEDAVADGRFSKQDEDTVLQLYLHLADLSEVSEVYILHDGFAPERGQVPFMMFDSVIVERFKSLVGDRMPSADPAEAAATDTPHEDEHAEYTELVRQLDYFRRQHPQLPRTAPQGVAALVSPPLITCDNSQFTSKSSSHDRDRRGVLLSVPIYDQVTGRFKGLVTTVLRLNVLEAKLANLPLVPVTPQEKAAARRSRDDAAPLSEFVLTTVRGDAQVFDRRNQELADVLAGKAQAAFSSRIPLAGPFGQAWVLERHVPQSTVDKINQQARQQIIFGTAVALSVLLMLSVAGWLLARQQRASRQLKELAEFDGLTGLPNRLQLDRLIEHSLRAAEAGTGQLSLLMIDLNKFKVVNDTLGHHIGDQLLVEVGRRFQKQLHAPEGLPTTDAEAALCQVGRLGGDEFLVVLANACDEAAACAVAERMLSSLAVPVVVDGQLLSVGASMGLAQFPQHGRTAKQLLRHADEAMYAAKRLGDSALVIYQRDVDHVAQRRRRLEADLRTALAQGQFELYYQAIFSLRQHRPDRAEALIRWHHPEFGLVPPNEFIPLLERSGLIVPVGLWVLRQAAQQLKAWLAAGLSIDAMSVNVSVTQLIQSDFGANAIEIFAQLGVDPRRIMIEVTESVLLDNPQRGIAQLQALRGAGVRVAIDDFGAGNASLTYLRQLPIDVLKIDRSLLTEAGTPNGRAVLVAMVKLAEQLGLDCTVEGVETAEQHQLLFAIGCPSAQGYLFARPLPAAQAETAFSRLQVQGRWSNSQLFTESCFSDP
jgi:diguanylate cyclase (GGDEF)-like protein